MKVTTKHWGIVEVYYGRDETGHEWLEHPVGLPCGKHQRLTTRLVPRDLLDPSSWEKTLDQALAEGMPKKAGPAGSPTTVTPEPKP